MDGIDKRFVYIILTQNPRVITPESPATCASVCTGTTTVPRLRFSVSALSGICLEQSGGDCDLLTLFQVVF